jgi:hypothetical protein
MTYSGARSETVILKADTNIVDKKGNIFLALSPQGQEYLSAFKPVVQPVTVIHLQPRDIR